MEAVLYFTKKLHAYAGRILYFNLLGIVFISLLDGIGVFLLIPMLSMTGMLNLSIGSTPVSGYFSFLMSFPKTYGLLLILGIYIVLIIGQSFVKRNLSLRDIKIHTGFINHIRLETYRALLLANWDFFTKKRKSDLINSLTEELGRVTSGTNLFLQFLASLVFTLIQVGIAFWLSVKMTLFVLFCGMISVFLSRRFISKAKMLGNQTTVLAKIYLAGITDHFNGIKDIKSNMLEESRYRWLNSWCEQIAHERYEHSKLTTNSQLLYKIAFALIIAVFIYFSVAVFDARGEQLLLIILIFSRLWPRFTSIQSNLEQIAASIPAFKALMKLQRDCKFAKESEGEHMNNKVEPLHMNEGLECRHVYFRYNPYEAVPTLQDINIHIPAKSMTAIVGPSGAGKSTLIDLLMGMLKPEQGRICVDGDPLTDDRIFSFRRSISYVPQDPFLFNASIRENLLLIEPDAREEQIWKALKFASAAEFVKKLPDGLDTIIGDRGVRLSGGERQRLVVARAILRQPSILILDEATSALDTENEANIQQALDNLKGTMTIIVVAHRLSTIRNADQVIVLDQGKVMQIGCFNQLAGEKGGLFDRLLANQLSDSRVVAFTRVP
ncbi:ABC transporter ATP-binding protein [Ferviditalea candida]|uniref:ABC transporter ATP-binding protein n=1 Tax=Ferviditalea candida TaxID=3108399 RepID=A0ABU5ZE54_9BACL|nr:ABC transporter ATP-binding protein [Paenibacillaceae bacterium T2]